DRDGVVAVVRTGAARGAAGAIDHLRCELEQVDEVAAEGGHAPHQRIGDLDSHALAGRRKVGGAAHGQRDRRQLHGLRRELRVHVRGLGKPDVDVVAYETLVADGAHAYRVRAADLEALHQEKARGTGARAARVARGA